MSDPDDRGRVVSDEERARALLEQLKSVHALDIGRDMVIAAVNFSYPKLGLSDETKAVRDLGDVRLSIELIRAILEVLDREDGDKTGDLHDTLAQMQLAYAHAVQLANAERAAANETEPAAPVDEEAQPAKAAAASAGRGRGAGVEGGQASGRSAAGGRGEAGGGTQVRREEACGKAEAGGEEEARGLGEARCGEEEAGAEKEAGRRQLIRRQTLESAQKRDSSSSSPASTTMNSSSCGPLTSFSRKRSDPVRCSSGRS